MEDPVFTGRDIHRMVKIFEKNGDLVANKDRLRGALELTLAEKEDIVSRAKLEGTGNYGFFSGVLCKWIERNGEKATLNSLVFILREEGFNSTADEFVRSSQISQASTPASTSTQSISSLFSQTSEISCASCERNALKPPKVGFLQKIRKSFRSHKVHSSNNTILMVPRVIQRPIPQWERREQDDAQNENNNNIAAENPETVSLNLPEPFPPNCLYGSQVEYEKFLRRDKEELKNLKKIEFHNIKMRAEYFLDCLLNCESLESIKFMDLQLLSVFKAKVWLPNLKVYFIQFDAQIKEGKQRISDPDGYSEHLICFSTERVSEHIWDICKKVNVELTVGSPLNETVLKTNTEDFELIVKGSHFKTHRLLIRDLSADSAFSTLTKLSLTRCTLPPSSFPPSLTHLSLILVSFTTGNLVDALKPLKELVSLRVEGHCDEWRQKDKIDLSLLSSMTMRHLSLSSVNIVCSGICTYRNLELLAINNCNVNIELLNQIPFALTNLKQCYFCSSTDMDGFLFLKRCLEIEKLELIVVENLRRNHKRSLTLTETATEIEEFLVRVNVPRKIRSFALEQKRRSEWKYVDTRDKSIHEMLLAYGKI